MQYKWNAVRKQLHNGHFLVFVSHWFLWQFTRTVETRIHFSKSTGRVSPFMTIVLITLCFEMTPMRRQTVHLCPLKWENNFSSIKKENKETIIFKFDTTTIQPQQCFILLFFYLVQHKAIWGPCKRCFSWCIFWQQPEPPKLFKIFLLLHYQQNPFPYKVIFSGTKSTSGSHIYFCSLVLHLAIWIPYRRLFPCPWCFCTGLAVACSSRITSEPPQVKKPSSSPFCRVLPTAAVIVTDDACKQDVPVISSGKGLL